MAMTRSTERVKMQNHFFSFFYYYIYIFFYLKMYFPDMHIFLNSYSMQTPACDIGKIEVKSILLITPLVFRNLKNKQFFQCSFLMPTLTLVTVQFASRVTTSPSSWWLSPALSSEQPAWKPSRGLLFSRSGEMSQPWKENCKSESLFQVFEVQCIQKEIIKSVIWFTILYATTACSLKPYG